MIETCKICGEKDLVPLWPDADGPEPRMWHRCICCGCDSADRTYPEVRELYQSNYAAYQASVNMEYELKELETNLNWFSDYRGKSPSNDFLDVGCWVGAALKGMQDMRWSVHGFDVIQPAYMGQHVTVAPYFSASLFQLRFGAVLCREVLEHVDGWLDLIQQLHAATDHNGLIQIQTPRPTRERREHIYAKMHIQLLTPYALRWYLERLGVEILDFKIWELGSAFIGQRFN